MTDHPDPQRPGTPPGHDPQPAPWGAAAPGAPAPMYGNPEPAEPPPGQNPEPPPFGTPPPESQPPAYGAPAPPPPYGAPSYGTPPPPPPYGAPSYGTPPPPPPFAAPGYGPTPGFGAAGYGSTPGYGAPSSPTPTSAIVLVVISALATLSCYFSLAGIPALVLGIIALTRNAQDPEGARRMAKIGWIVLGAVSAVILVLVVGFFVLVATTSSNG